MGTFFTNTNYSGPGFFAANYKFCKLLLLLVLAFLFLSSHAHAQPKGLSISWDELTAANGWKCNENYSSCTNNKAGSPWNGGTASCTKINANETTPMHYLCEGTTAEGDTAVASTAVGGATVEDKTNGVIDQTDKNVQESQGAAAAAGKEGGCEIWSPGSWPTCIIDGVGLGIMFIANFFLGIAGVLFNYVIAKSVFEFGSVIGNSEGLLAAWGILRDIGNMVLLFGFIFMGLATILDLHSFPVKKALPRLLIFAILMNFSLFAAEAVIDVSNALSTEMYNAANTTPCASGTTSDDWKVCFINVGLAGHVMNSTGLSTVYEITSGSGFLGSAGIYLALALFATIGAVVFIAASIMLAFRLVILTFLMVSSPIGFAGMAIPPLQQYANMWWNKLLSQAFFAPVLILLILISLKITDAFNTQNIARNGLANAVINHNVDSLGIVMVYLIVIGFLIASLVVAKSMGASGSAFAVNFATRFAYGGMARATNTAFGGSAYAARYLQQKYAPESKVGKAINKRLLTPMVSTNFDARKVPGMGKLLGTIGAGDAAKPAEHASFEDIKHQFDDFKEDKRGQEREADYQSRVKKQQLEKEAHDGALSTESQNYLASLSEKQLMDLHGIKTGVEGMAKNLTPEQFDKLMNNKDLDDRVKSKMRNDRFNSLSAKIKDAAANPTDKTKQDEAKKAIKALANKDLAQLMQSTDHAGTVLADDNIGHTFTSMLSDDQFKETKKGLSPAQQAALEKSRDLMNSPASVAARIQTMKAEDIAKLPGKALADTAVLTQMSGRNLAAIDPDKLSGSELDEIKKYIESEKAAGTAKWNEFEAMLRVNPKVLQRWGGIIV